METEFKTPFARAAKRCNGYVHTPSKGTMRGITKTLRHFYPDYSHQAAVFSESITSGTTAASKGAGGTKLRLYGRQTPMSAAMKRGATVGSQLEAVLAAMKKHKLPLREFVALAKIEVARKHAKRKAGAVRSKQQPKKRESRSKAAVAARARIPDKQQVISKEGELTKLLPAGVRTMMGKLLPLTLHVLRFISDQGWCIAAVELEVGHVKARFCTGVDLLLWSPKHQQYILTELKTGYAGGAHERHTGHMLAYPFEDRVDSPKNFIQLQLLCTDILFRETLPHIPLLRSQELLVRSVNAAPEVFELAPWAEAKRSKFWAAFCKQ